MGTLTSVVSGKLVAFDSPPLIYYIEQHSVYFAVADELFNAVRQRLARGLTSALKLAEVLVKPLRSGRRELADNYRRFLGSTRGVIVCPIEEAVCERAARLRAEHGWLRTPDALQVATALEYDAELMVTNDDRWRRLREIQIVVLKDYVGASP